MFLGELVGAMAGPGKYKLSLEYLVGSENKKEYKKDRAMSKRQRSQLEGASTDQIRDNMSTRINNGNKIF